MKITAVAITSTQIRKLRASKDWSLLWLREFAIALGEITTVNDPIGDLRSARSRCADLFRRGAA